MSDKNDLTITKGSIHTLKFFWDNECAMVECEYSGLKQVVNGVTYHRFTNTGSKRAYILSEAKLATMIGERMTDCDSFTISI